MQILMVVLRLLTMGSKFIFLTFMAKQFDPELIGEFGLISTVILFSVYFTGLDFYVFTNRLIFNYSVESRNQLVHTQAAIAGIAFVIVVVTLMLTYNKIYGLNGNLMIILIFIIFIEYVSQELYRLLIVFDKQIDAAILFFFKSGLWCLLAVVYFLLGHFDYKVIYLMWIISGGIGIVYGAVLLRKEIRWLCFLKFSPRISVAKEGLLISLKYFLLSASLRSIEYIDRFFIDSHLGKTLLGAYTYFWSMSSVVQSILVVAVINVWYPRIINNKNSAYEEVINKKYRKIFGLMVAWGVIIIPTIYFMGSWMVSFFGKTAYMGNDLLYLVLIFASFTSAMSQIPQLKLYADNKDNIIIIGGISGAVISVILNATLVPFMGLMGSAIAYLSSSIWVALWYFVKSKDLKIAEIKKMVPLTIRNDGND